MALELQVRLEHRVELEATAQLVPREHPEGPGLLVTLVRLVSRALSARLDLLVAQARQEAPEQQELQADPVLRARRVPLEPRDRQELWDPRVPPDPAERQVRSVVLVTRVLRERLDLLVQAAAREASDRQEAPVLPELPVMLVRRERRDLLERPERLARQAELEQLARRARQELLVARALRVRRARLELWARPVRQALQERMAVSVRQDLRVRLVHPARLGVQEALAALAAQEALV